MQLKAFHDRLSGLMPTLDAILAAGGDFSNQPTYKGLGHGLSTCTLDFLLAKIRPLMETGPNQSPAWPRTDSPVAVINLDGVDAAFTDPASYVLRAQLAVVVDIHNVGKFVLFIAEQPSKMEYYLTGWSFLSLAGGDFSYLHLGLKGEEYHTVGSEVFLSDSEDYIFSRVENAIMPLANDADILQINLNNLNTISLHDFSMNDGWDLLPWISNNEYIEKFDLEFPRPLGWHRNGPFDTLQMSIKVDGQPEHLYTVFVLNRNQVVQCVCSVNGHRSAPFRLTTAAQMKPFWHAVNELLQAVKQELRTTL